MASSVVAAGVSVVRASPRSRATSIRTSCRRPAQNAPLPSIPAILASSGGGRGGFSSVTALVGRTRRRRSTGDSTLLRRGSREEDPPPSTYVQAQSLATSIADAKWFNTYIHGAVFVCILGGERHAPVYPSTVRVNHRAPTRALCVATMGKGRPYTLHPTPYTLNPAP
jgi:hypothetical protein